MRIGDFAAMFIMGVLSLGLLAYIGFGEAGKKYPAFEIEKVTAQARTIHASLEKFLNAGIPLQQFAGFDTRVTPIIKADPAIDAIYVLNSAGQVVLDSRREGVADPGSSKFDPELDSRSVERGAIHTKVTLPLRSRFGFGGQLVILIPNDYIKAQVDNATRWLPIAASIGALLLGAFGFLISGKPAAWRSKWERIVFSVVFLGVAGTVVTGLASLYADGVQSKVTALGDALTERISVIWDLNLEYADIEGVDRAFAEYRQSFPELKTIAMIVDGVVILHSDPAAIGKPLVEDSNAYGDFADVDEHPGLNVRVYVSIPKEIVLFAVGQSAKTFTVLLVASGFIAALFFQLGGALRGMRAAKERQETDGQSAVEAIKPALFMGFFIENLAVSFLPQLMQKSAAASGLPSFMVSAMFMAYFVTFAFTLVPAGIFAEKRGPTPLIFVGAIVVAIAAGLLASSDHYSIIIASRLLSGFGQGLLFIGSQSFILAYAKADRRTQSAGIIVYTFNGGMLSGMVIGGLLVGYVGPAGVFWLGAAIAICIAVYTWLLVAPPKVSERSQPTAAKRPPGSILRVFRSGGFVWTTLLVGIPAKAVLTGVIIFAMPLILSGMKLDQEDIGQIIMFYAFGVLLSSHYVSRYVDAFGNIRNVLTIGLTLSGVGMVIIGSLGFPSFYGGALSSVAVSLLLLTGTFIVGVGHGCINAPVVTHIASTSAGQELGEAPTTAFYRFIERLGHIAGPMIVGQLFFVSDRSPGVVAWLGVAMVVFAIPFWLRRDDRKKAA